MRTLLFLLLLPVLLFAQDFSVYISDAGNFDAPPWQILRVDANGQNPQTFIDSELAWPQDILFLEDQGVVLISNLNSGRITRHDAESGEYINNFATGISGPTRMKIGADGLLYVLQWSGNGLVLRYELDGTPLGAFTQAGVGASIGLDWDAEGRLHVSSYNGDHVRRFNTDGSDDGILVGTDLLGPTNIWFDEAGDLLVVDYNGTAVKRFNSEGLYQGDFLTGLGSAEGVAFLPGGDILVGNGQDSSVRRYSPDGTSLGAFVASGAGGLLRPNAVVLREAGTGLEPGLNSLPESLSILGLWPNPFNPATTLAFRLPAPAPVTLRLHDLRGALVLQRALGRMPAGEHQFALSASGLAGGLYLCSLSDGRHRDVRRLTILP